MINQMTIDGVKAVITYDSDIDMFRGEFLGLNGGADFYPTFRTPILKFWHFITN